MTLDVNADYVSSPQAAKILRITYVGVAQLARQGKIPAVKIANRWLIPRAFVEEFARTYEGRRGRPRKNRRLAAGLPAAQAAPKPSMAEPSAVSDVSLPRQETSGILAINAWIADLEETPALPAPDAKFSNVEPTGAGDLRAAVDAVPSIDARIDQEQGIPSVVPQADESPPGMATPVASTSVSPETVSGAVQMGEVGAVSESAGISGPSDGTFSISTEVYHLDKNYDFEVYEKGLITERARLIVARLKPKIPSLPQFSFRWDYRYEHLNVDIHGVEPTVIDWWTMGENGYTGHLPRRLGGPGYAFEAIIWLPVTFVFRGRLTLSLRGSPEAGEDSPSVATTTGGLRKLWAKWPTFPK